jgi:putative ATP-dependent endonuclease of OLD family
VKITKIHIKNYRSLEDVTITPNNILALVGGNNSGKSSVLKALELFFEASKELVDAETVHYKHQGEPIEILLTFKQLSPWEKEQFGPWMDGDKLVVGRQIDSTNYEITTVAVKSVPEPDWLQEDVISGTKISEWWPNRASLKVGENDFSTKFGTSKSEPQVGKWKAAAQEFAQEHKKEIKWIEKAAQNPKGYAGVLKGALPEFILIPAVRDVTQETKILKTNPFGQLLKSFFDAIPQENRKELDDKIKELEKRFNRSGKTNRFTQIDAFEKRMNELMQEVMQCDVEIEVPLPKIEEVMGAAKIYVDDGTRTSIETKGHGMQRTMIFTILRAYAELTHQIKAADRAKQRTTIFAFEEPELYMHPQSQRTLMSVIRDIAENQDQVIYCTHSSLFVDIEHFNEICIMRREKTGDYYKSQPSQLSMEDMLVDFKKRYPEKTGTAEGMRELYSNAFNPIVSEGFFAQKVVVVEGPSEQYALPIYADCVGYDLNQCNVSVVHADGKSNIDRLLRIFGGFGIPTYAMFDGDKNSKKQDAENARKATIDLMAMLGDKITKDQIAKKVTSKYAVLEDDIEKLLRSEIPDYEALITECTATVGPSGKPVKNRFVAKKIKQKISAGSPAVQVVPKTIQDIIEAIKKANCPSIVPQK